MNMLNLNDLINAMEELHGPTTRWRRINLRLDPQLPPIKAAELPIRRLILNMIAYVTQAWMEGDHELNLATRATILSSHDLQLCDIGRSMPAGSYVELTVFHAEQHGSRQALPARSLPANLDGITPLLHRCQGAGCVQSFPHAGVNVYLPTTAPVVAANRHIQTKSRQLAHPKLGTILVIDDESEVRGVIAKMIERMGFRVEVAASGVQGIATIKSGISDLRVVLLDLSMAEMNGIEAAEAIQALLPTLPIILMSGYSAEDIHPQDNRLAIHSFIQKPFSYKTLEALLKQNSGES
jgi:two-component system, cell cycle sensor histidine kinase and response regulator CckA